MTYRWNSRIYWPLALPQRFRFLVSMSFLQEQNSMYLCLVFLNKLSPSHSVSRCKKKRLANDHCSFYDETFQPRIFFSYLISCLNRCCRVMCQSELCALNDALRQYLYEIITSLNVKLICPVSGTFKKFMQKQIYWFQLCFKAHFGFIFWHLFMVKVLIQSK